MTASRRFSPIPAAMWLACGASAPIAADDLSLASMPGDPISSPGTAPASVHIVLGSRSPELEQLALRLGQRYPCLAVTLLQFGKEDWARARDLHWQLPGSPSTRTVDLLVHRAEAAEILKSMPPPGNGIYIFNGLGVELLVDSREEAGNRMVSAISARIVDGNDVTQGLLEPAARVQWSRTDSRILSIELADEPPQVLMPEAMFSGLR